MKIYDELVARGLIAQVTNEAEIKEMVDNGKAVFYIGFDPTADPVHPIAAGAGSVAERSGGILLRYGKHRRTFAAVDGSAGGAG